jgi:poly(3-hydroxybutyrate) depolymerase
MARPAAGRARAAFLAAALAAACAACAGETAPVAAADDSPRLVQLRPGTHSVAGRLAEFDPRHRSVDLRLPPGAGPFPLVVFVHGGGGASDSLAAMAAFHAQGVAVLGFDAYATNGFDRPSSFWVREVTYEARQRMIFRVARGAVAWGAAQERIDPGRVYAYGLSNGADVVVNLAAAMPRSQLRGAIAEGMAGAGLGLPDRLQVPLEAVFGRLDDYGAPNPGTWRWERRVPCALTTPVAEAPPGSAARCNARTGGFGETPMAWIERQRAAGAEIRVRFYDEAAHGIFAGPLRRRTQQWGDGSVFAASTGAAPEARDKLLADLLEVVRAR